MKKQEIKKIIKDLKVKIEEKKKIPVVQCSWCGLSHQVKEVEILQVELCVWEQSLEVEKR